MTLRIDKLSGVSKILILCCSLVLFSSCNSSKNTSKTNTDDNDEVRQPEILHRYPKYEEIRIKFLETYSFQQYNGLFTTVDFEKRPDGWHVVLKSYQDGSGDIVFHELYWEHSSGTHKKLNLPEVTSPDENASIIRQIFRTSFYYDICPYYGYPGWELELINSCSEHYSNFSDTLLFALAYAHHSYASGLVNPYNEYSDESRAFELPMTPNALSNRQLDEYLGYVHKGLELYERVALSNPDFNTIVGTINIKVANERMWAFSDLLILQNEREARKLLKPEIYPSYVLDISKRILESCPKNALLFTSGDNDTYPLWYVQSQYDIRSDVKVINKSLLNLDRYALQLEVGDKGSPIVRTSLSPEQVDSIRVVYLRDDYNSSSAVTLPAFLAKVKAESSSHSPNKLSRLGQLTIESNKTLIIENVFPPDDLSIAPFAEPTSISINWGKNYMSRGDIVALDLINQFINKRPICFVSYSGKQGVYFTNDHLMQYGYVDILYPHSNLSGGFSEESAEKTYSTFIRPDITKSERTAFTEDEKSFSRWTRWLYLDVSKALLAAGQNEKAQSTIETSFKLFPIGLFPFDFYHLDGIKSLLDLGDKYGATKHINAALANLEKTHAELNDSINESNNPNADQFNFYCEQLRYTISYHYSDESSASWISQLEAML